MMGRPVVSVVVIARNEERHIGRALESALEASARLEAEVIFVDSASTDATAEVAGRYPVRLLRLEPGWFLSPAAGRHVGLAAASGEFVFFLDGDSELEAGFLEAALPVLAAGPAVAAVLGKRREVVRTPEGRSRVVEEDAYAVTAVRHWLPGHNIGGSGLYRRRALQEVGGFNPWLCSWEEAELGARLFDAGHHILFIPQPMITHLDHHPLDVGELARRWREKLLLGRGQVLRLYPFRRAPYQGLSRILGMMGLWALLPPLAAAAAILGQPWVLAAWPLSMLALFAAFALRAGGLRKPAFYFLFWTLSAVKLIQGFLMAPRDPADYPLPAGLSPETHHGEAHERPADNHRLLADRQAGQGCAAGP